MFLLGDQAVSGVRIWEQSLRPVIVGDDGKSSDDSSD
jgi:hypothetical protein